MAQRYGVRVVFRDDPLPEGCLLGDAIILSSNLHPARLNWTFCHELAHYILGHNNADHYRRDTEEIEANRLAAELMLPEADFRPLVPQLDLAALKARFSHASWEVIARRRAQFQPAVVTIYDNRRLTSRWGPEGLAYPRYPTAEEHQLALKCFDERTTIQITSPPFTLTAHFVDEGFDVVRVVMLTEIDPFTD